MQPAKLQFSTHEMNLVADAGWILTKNEILNKVSHILGEVNLRQKSILAAPDVLLPEKVMATTPKISRGENYKGLPYLVLDYPRLFKKENIFAVRSFFWWGKTLSTTIHLSGEWKKMFSEKITGNYSFLAENGFVAVTGADEWVHDVMSDDYKKIEQLTLHEFKELIAQKDFLKIAVYRSINELNNAVSVWEDHFSRIIGLIK